MFGLGGPELIVVGVIIFLIFGAKRLPDIGKGLGGAIREFRHVKKDLRTDDGKPPEKDSKAPPSLEGQIAQKALGQVPGVKQAMDLKDKVSKVKSIIQS